MRKSKNLTPEATNAQVIDGRTVKEWKKWRHLPDWQNANSPMLRGSAGLIRFRRNGEVVYIGCAGARGGFRKRLRDFTRPSSSGRNHHGGQLIHEHADELEVDLIVTGTTRKANATNLKLRKALLGLRLPRWNVPGLT